MAITNRPARIALSLLYRQLWHAAKVDDFERFHPLAYVYKRDMHSPAIHIYAGDADANCDVCSHHSLSYKIVRSLSQTSSVMTRTSRRDGLIASVWFELTSMATLVVISICKLL